jgi:hypothetical protein
VTNRKRCCSSKTILIRLVIFVFNKNKPGQIPGKKNKIKFSISLLSSGQYKSPEKKKLGCCTRLFLIDSPEKGPKPDKNSCTSRKEDCFSNSILRFLINAWRQAFIRQCACLRQLTRKVIVNSEKKICHPAKPNFLTNNRGICPGAFFVEPGETDGDRSIYEARRDCFTLGCKVLHRWPFIKFRLKLFSSQRTLFQSRKATRLEDVGF